MWWALVFVLLSPPPHPSPFYAWESRVTGVTHRCLLLWLITHDRPVMTTKAESDLFMVRVCHSTLRDHFIWKKRKKRKIIQSNPAVISKTQGKWKKKSSGILISNDFEITGFSVKFVNSAWATLSPKVINTGSVQLQYWGFHLCPDLFRCLICPSKLTRLK